MMFDFSKGGQALKLSTLIRCLGLRVEMTLKYKNQLYIYYIIFSYLFPQILLYYKRTFHILSLDQYLLKVLSDVL
jgi:hypothetical protein